MKWRISLNAVATKSLLEEASKEMEALIGNIPRGFHVLAFADFDC
jgi:hypothetical protein